MASLQPSSVSNIMKALNELKEKIDSLNIKVVDMKKNLNQKTNSEIDKIMEKTREIATKEAEVIINETREKANAQSQSIAQEADGKIAELQSKIDASFDDAVKHVVSTVLKA